ncbi:MAG: hypothetical protein IKI84_13515 [Clostridia bacterium]|nr:hypothetical protein [Clostridia bacterium]
MIHRKNRNEPEAKAALPDPERENQKLRSALVEIAAEKWRFEHALKKALQKMDVMDAERFNGQFGYFSSRVAQAMAYAGMSCLDLSGQVYDVGMPVQGMNLDEFDEDEILIITRMVEPVILWNGRVIRTGMVLLGRAGSSRETEE